MTISILIQSKNLNVSIKYSHRYTLFLTALTTPATVLITQLAQFYVRSSDFVVCRFENLRGKRNVIFLKPFTSNMTSSVTDKTLSSYDIFSDNFHSKT